MLSNIHFQENIRHTDYEIKIISSGDNFPSIDISESQRHYLLVMIRSGIDIQSIKQELNSRSTYQLIIKRRVVKRNKR